MPQQVSNTIKFIVAACYYCTSGLGGAVELLSAFMEAKRGAMKMMGNIEYPKPYFKL
jgi:hypothetical protein